MNWKDANQWEPLAARTSKPAAEHPPLSYTRSEKALLILISPELAAELKVKGGDRMELYRNKPPAGAPLFMIHFTVDNDWPVIKELKNGVLRVRYSPAGIPPELMPVTDKRQKLKVVESHRAYIIFEAANTTFNRSTSMAAVPTAQAPKRRGRPPKRKDPEMDALAELGDLGDDE